MAADDQSGTRESFLTNEKGKQLFCRYWCEDLINPRALVFINHGAGEHCLWYTQLALMLKEKGCFVFAHDHVGHGQSEGDRVHIEDFHDYVQDVFQHFSTVAAKFPDLPKFMIGHSMGGAISIIAGMEKPEYFNGIILIAPAVIPDPHTVSPTKIFLGKIAAKVWPQAPVLKLNPDDVSRDKAVVMDAISAEIQRRPFGVPWELKGKWLDWIEKNMSKMTCPVLTLHGTEDKMTNIQGSRVLHEGISSSDKTLKIYDGYYHQLHNEPGQDGAGVRQEIVDWISARTRGAAH
ncbi:hypothetical protein BaRGS_00012045 [Batillaria attramentaria]|uniref:Serine aminopeptidase S33 domain-containing protein n=1 Tax=Batillaria attramentaria TaxID=370345 RepID=A0ABD0LBN4_9CAEN